MINRIITQYRCPSDPNTWCYSPCVRTNGQSVAPTFWKVPEFSPKIAFDGENLDVVAFAVLLDCSYCCMVYTGPFNEELGMPKSRAAHPFRFVDAETLRRLQDRDHSTWEKVVRTTSALLYVRITQFVPDETDALDLVSLTHLRAMERIDTFGTIGKGYRFLAWLLRIAERLALSHVDRTCREGRNVSRLAYHYHISYVHDDLRCYDTQDAISTFIEDRVAPAFQEIIDTCDRALIDSCATYIQYKLGQTQMTEEQALAACSLDKNKCKQA